MGKTLIVDDEDDMRLLLQLTIDDANRGLRVVGQASSGDEALTIHDQLDVDVIVLDQQMPGRTGTQTAEALLARDPDVPIVLYSAYLDDSVAAQAERAGVRRCVKKGDIAALILALRELTGLDVGEPSP
jgi:two-component system invasion response regulator UvrY